MWWWQSVALAGAFSLGASLPADHFTLWAEAGRGLPPKRLAAAVSESVVKTSRRFQSVGIVASPWLTFRKPQHALAEDVALDLARPCGDRVLPRGHQPVEPAGRVGHQLGALVDEGVHAEQLAGGVRDAHAQLGAGELEDRA